MNKSTSPRSKPAFNKNWTIVIFGFLALSLSFSARAALGLVMPVWQEEFGWTTGFISNVGATALIVIAIVAPFAGRLIDKTGPRFTLNLGLGLLGIGCSLVALMNGELMFIIGFSGFAASGFGIVATHVVATSVAKTFHSKPGLATGIATSGSTGGQFLIVPLIAGLLAFYSWRWSFAAMGLASFLLIPCIFASMKSASQKPAQTSTEKDATTGFLVDFKFIVKKPAFHALFWSFLICGFTTAGVIETHLLPFASWCGFPPIASATAYGVLSAVNLAGMIAAGWLTDRVNRIFLLASIYILRSFTFILLASMPGSSLDSLFIFALFFGIVDYSTVPVTASLVASHVGLKVMGLAMGLISAGHAIGGAAGAFLGGYVMDYTGNYDLLWSSSLWLAIGAGAIVLLMPSRAKTAVPA